MGRMSTGMTMALIMFMVVGLTAHFYNAMWIFWGICIGVRASLREYELASSVRADRGGAINAGYRPASL